MGGLRAQYAGVVRRVNTTRLNQLLNSGDIVLVGCLGYSAAGEVFNCSSEEVATACAAQIGAQKLVFMYEGDLVYGMQAQGKRERVNVHSMTVDNALNVLSALEQHEQTVVLPPYQTALSDAQVATFAGGDCRTSTAAEAATGAGKQLQGRGHEQQCTPPRNHEQQQEEEEDGGQGEEGKEEFAYSWSFPMHLRLAVGAVQAGVQRVHLVNRHVDGALLGELYTEAGMGLVCRHCAKTKLLPNCELRNGNVFVFAFNCAVAYVLQRHS